MILFLCVSSLSCFAALPSADHILRLNEAHARERRASMKTERPIRIKMDLGRRPLGDEERERLRRAVERFIEENRDGKVVDLRRPCTPPALFRITME